MTDDRSPLTDLLERLQNDRTASLLTRVDELRKRILRLLIVVFVIFCVCFTFGAEILGVLKLPLQKAMPNTKSLLHFAGPMEVFYAYVKVSFLTAAVIVGPFFLQQAWVFLAPAFPEHERKLARPVFFSSIILFIAGVTFCYFVLLPVTLEFLVGMGQDVATPTLMVDDYMSLVVFMLLGFGGVFQLPLVLIILERFGVIKEEHLTKNRGAILIAILIVAAVITPTPDPLSQLAMAVPMYLMFEAAIIIIKRMKKSSARAQALVKAG